MVLILSKLEYRLVEMQSQIENIKGKLTNEPDVATIVYITEGLNKYTKKIIEFRESLASNPDSISNILSRRQKMAIFRHK
jgi:hypothetical protein